MAAKALHQFQESESAEIQELYRIFLLEKTPVLLGPKRVDPPFRSQFITSS